MNCYKLLFIAINCFNISLSGALYGAEARTARAGQGKPGQPEARSGLDRGRVGLKKQKKRKKLTNTNIKKRFKKPEQKTQQTVNKNLKIRIKLTPTKKKKKNDKKNFPP